MKKKGLLLIAILGIFLVCFGVSAQAFPKPNNNDIPTNDTNNTYSSIDFFGRKNTEPSNDDGQEDTKPSGDDNDGQKDTEPGSDDNDGQEDTEPGSDDNDGQEGTERRNDDDDDKEDTKTSVTEASLTKALDKARHKDLYGTITVQRNNSDEEWEVIGQDFYSSHTLKTVMAFIFAIFAIVIFLGGIILVDYLISRNHANKAAVKKQKNK